MRDTSQPPGAQHRLVQLIPDRRAQPPRPPAPTASLRKAHAEQAAYLQDRELLERRSVHRGLILLALAALAVSLLRAGADRAFYAGWWRTW